MSSDAPPIACDPSAIAEEEREEHSNVADAVFAAVGGVEEVEDGYAFRLPASTAAIKNAGAFVSRERLCCPFFHFSRDVAPDEGPVWLTMTGRDGVKEYIEEAVLSYWNLSENGGEAKQKRSV